MKPCGIWTDPGGIIRWLILASKTDATKMPFFPDKVVLLTIIRAIEDKEIEVPEDKKEAVASAVLKFKLDFGGSHE